MNQNQQPGHAASAIAQAETQHQVGSGALDWTDRTDAAYAFRSLFADVMVHNMSLLSGVMKGADRLIQEFSPDALIQAFEEARRARSTGISFGPYRYRELWRALERRHRDFTKEETGIYSLLFGQEFAAMYEQFFSATAAETRVEPRAPRAAMPPAGGAAVEKAPRSALSESTPENHGFPPKKAQGPTGTVIVPRNADAAVKTDRIAQTPSRGERS